MRHHPVVRMNDVRPGVVQNGDDRGRHCSVQAANPLNESGRLPGNFGQWGRDANDVHTVATFMCRSAWWTLSKYRNVVALSCLFLCQCVDMAAQTSVHDRWVLPGDMQNVHDAQRPDM